MDTVLHEITPLGEKDCLYIADRHKKEYTYPIHNHSVFELNFTEHAAGVRRRVGDHSEVIGDYDLVLITSAELEHVWEQNECTSPDIREVTVQFTLDLNTPMLQRTPFISMRRMLERAQNGLAFPLSAIMHVYPLLDTLSSEKDGFYSVLKFYSILYELSKCNDARMLSSSSFAKVELPSDSRRVTKVQQYISMHYLEELRLSQLSDLAGMTPTAFSRFFKLHTGKSLSDYIIDMRLGLAARQLVDTSKSIAEISFYCGFNNLSNFNRIFKKRKNCSPKEFREVYHKKRIIV